MPLETVTYLRRDLANDTPTTYTGVVALRTAITGEVTGIGGPSQTTQSLAHFHVQASTLAIIPRKGDRIIDTAGTWEILSADTLTLGTRFLCRTKKVA